MRIFHVIPYMHPTAGGPPAVVEALVRESNRAGHLSEIATTTMFCRGDEQTLLQELNNLSAAYFLPKWLPKANALLSSSIRRSDIVLIHTCWHFGNVLTRRQCVRSWRPYVLMPHGYLDPYSLSKKRVRKAAYLWAVERKVLSGAHRIIYTSQEEQRLATGKLPWLPVGTVLPLGANPPDLAKSELADGFFARFPALKNRPILLFLGRLDPKKGIDRILSLLPIVIERVPQTILVIAGGGSSGFEAKVRRWVAERGLTDQVLFTGWLDGLAKWQAYAAATLFLLLSRQENFALSVAEAMHMGLPVVISKDVNIWPDVVAAECGVAVDDPDSREAVADLVVRLLSAPQALRDVGQRSATFAARQLTWFRAGQALMACFHRVLLEHQSEHLPRL